MKKLVFWLSLVGLGACGIDKSIDSVNAMPEKMDLMNIKMDKTNEAVRLQKLSIAKDGMEDPRNAEVLLPIPVGIMPYAQTFADNAKQDEVTGQIYLYLKEINDGLHKKSVDDTGSEKDFTFQEMNTINQHKLHRYAAAQAISGFLPHSMIEELVREHVYMEGRFQKTVYAILMMRYQFIRDVLLTNSLLSESIENVGSITEAVNYVTHMDWIARRPFLERVEVKITGFFPPYGEYYEGLTQDSARDSMLAMIDVIESRAQQVEKVVQMSDSAFDEQKKQAQAGLQRQLKDDQSKLNTLKVFWLQK